MTIGIEYVDLTVPVVKRKHTTDIIAFRQFMKEHKRAVGKTIQQIASDTQVSKTEAEHWFRQDSCFSVPRGEVWGALKRSLGLPDSEYDAFVTEFEEVDGVFEKAGRVYFTGGIAPTLTSTSAAELILEVN